MRILSTFFIFIPFMGIGQFATALELSMYDYSQFVLKLDNQQFKASKELSIEGIKPGEHVLEVYLPKEYINPFDGSLTTRLIPVYSGEVEVFENKCTSCVIDKFHEKRVEIK